MKSRIKHRVPFNFGDYAMIGLLLLTVISSSLLIITESSRVASVNTAWQQTQAQLDDVNMRNTRLHEDATRLSSPERLLAIAKEHGLTYNKDNIKHVK